MKINPLEHWISRKIGNGGDPSSRETLEAYQLEKLNETIGWARKNSSFYRARLADFEKAGISRLSDLARFPFTTADDIRHDLLQFLFVRTGGSGSHHADPARHAAHPLPDR